MKRKICIIGFIITGLTLISGCVSVTNASMTEFVNSLEAEGLNFEPGSPATITNPAMFPPNLFPITLQTYERRTDTGELIDMLLIQSFPDEIETEQIQSDLQLYADDEFGLAGLDLGGPLHYYSCSDNIIAVYQARWSIGIDSSVDEVMSDKCGEAFIEFPPQ